MYLDRWTSEVIRLRPPGGGAQMQASQARRAKPGEPSQASQARRGLFGPQGGDGYSAPIWDKVSGQIHHAVARAWMPMDIGNYLMTHWPTIGPELAGKINFFVGTADTFFLNDAVQLLQQNVANLASPPADF